MSLPGWTPHALSRWCFSLHAGTNPTVLAKRIGTRREEAAQHRRSHFSPLASPRQAALVIVDATRPVDLLLCPKATPTLALLPEGCSVLFWCQERRFIGILKDMPQCPPRPVPGVPPHHAHIFCASPSLGGGGCCLLIPSHL